MGLLRSTTAFDRGKILKAAARARSRRRRKRAIALYRWVLAAEPNNADLHGKLAPMLARTGHHFDAWVSFRRAARGLAKDGHIEKALGIYREAASCLPRQLETWLAIFELERQRGRDADARDALLEGRRAFRRRHLRAQAIYLLRRARTIEPWDPEVVIDLCSLLAKTGQRYEAEMLLEELATRARGRELRRIRALQWRMRPGVSTSLLLLHALFLSTDRPARATR